MSSEIKQMKLDFLHREVSVASYVAAFGMAIKIPFYASHINTSELRASIQGGIRHELWKLLTRFKGAPWDNDELHILELHAFLQHINETHGGELANGCTTFGRTQKLVNLYFKYMWCAGYIPQPPHCPVDGVILEALRKEARNKMASRSFTVKDIPTSFTNLDEATYRRVIDYIREVAGEHGTPGEWELRIFNARP